MKMRKIWIGFYLNDFVYFISTKYSVLLTRLVQGNETTALNEVSLL